MSPGSSTESYPAFARIGSRENPGKYLNKLVKIVLEEPQIQKNKQNTAQYSQYGLVCITHFRYIILPVLLYGCETWTLTLREEHRLRVFENKVLRKIFGAKRDEVTGEWRKLHNAELHALYSSPDIIRNIKSRRLRWAGHVARMGESRNAYRVLVGRPEGKRPLGRPRRRWEGNIKMDLREVGYDDRDWINLAQDRDRWRAYVRAAMNLRRNKRKPTSLQKKEHLRLPRFRDFNSIQEHRSWAMLIRRPTQANNPTKSFGIQVGKNAVAVCDTYHVQYSTATDKPCGTKVGVRLSFLGPRTRYIYKTAT
ncbi:hypothetical protein ANN_00081 [Periplaneta americana]|uniref:Endonuclease-reverse transcriptase n=1 Tax=Periplaneta americana TaxID=6978 RepID=A0ABQ8TPS1_PERAM|nr:hypothetical protein ANN_00081 [Periplaneta americana]